MKMTRTEQWTVSLARGAAGKAGDGQMVTLLVVALLAATSLRMQVDLGVVVSVFCLMGVLSVLERRQVYGLFRRLEQIRGTGPSASPDSTTA